MNTFISELPEKVGVFFAVGDEVHVGGLITRKEDAKKKPHLYEPENFG